MKFKQIYLVGALFAATCIASSCKKDSENIFNMFSDVAVTCHGDHPLSVTDYKLVNDGDSVYIDYTITSAKEDMYSVVVERSDNRVSRTTIKITDDTKRRSYSDVVKLKILRDGKTSYRVYGLNEKGYFIGDGGKTIVIESAASYNHIPNRKLYLPDTVTKVNPSYFSIAKNGTFNYTEASANPGDIDFGVYRNMLTKVENGTTTISYEYFLYTPIANPNPLTVYDMSGWATKRAVYFGSTNTNKTNDFRTLLVSSTVLETEAKKKKFDLTKSSAKLAAGNLIYFLTPEGKYGSIHINAITKDIDGKPYVDVSVKVQK